MNELATGRPTAGTLVGFEPGTLHVGDSWIERARVRLIAEIARGDEQLFWRLWLIEQVRCGGVVPKLMRRSPPIRALEFSAE